jgi:hypothetical protein
MNSEQHLFSLVEDIQRREIESGLHGLSPFEQVFAAVWSLEGEVNNGGFDQYFFNSAGDHAAAAKIALVSIGALRTAAVLAQAMALFGSSGPSEDQSTRQEQLEVLAEASDEPFESLDQEFLRYPEDLSELLASHMSKNAA